MTAATESRPKSAAARPPTSTARPSSRLLASPAVRFLVVGGTSTLGYLALYALLRLALPSQVANMVALLATGDINTVVNRRWAFRMKGPVPHQERAKGVVAYLVSLVATSTALAPLDVVGAQGSTAELTALLTANALAGIVHYVLLRTWAFHPGPHPVGPRHEHRHPTPGTPELCPAQLPPSPAGLPSGVRPAGRRGSALHREQAATRIWFPARAITGRKLCSAG